MLTLDLEPWHSVDPTDEPIPLAITFDRELRKATDDDGSEEVS